MTLLLDLVRSLVGAISRQRELRRDHVNRVADFLDKVAVEMEDAVAALRAGRLPYREYVALHYYANSFESVVADQFPESKTAASFEEFRDSLSRAIGAIAYSDLVLTGFKEIPLPEGVWNGKSRWIPPPEQDPPVGTGGLSRLDGPLPEINEIDETAAVFRAQANILRAL